MDSRNFKGKISTGVFLKFCRLLIRQTKLIENNLKLIHQDQCWNAIFKSEHKKCNSEREPEIRVWGLWWWRGVFLTPSLIGQCWRHHTGVIHHNLLGQIMCSLYSAEVNFTCLMNRSNRGQRNFCLLHRIRHSQLDSFQHDGACKPSMGLAYLGITQVRSCSQFHLWKTEQKSGPQCLFPLLAAGSSFEFPLKNRAK